MCPSTFNIFRDKLADVNAQMHELFLENLPQMHLNEESGSEQEEEIVPLDFRTAMVDGKLYIQAKPMAFKTDEEILKDEAIKALEPDKAMTEDDYLTALKMESFRHDDEDVVLIDPGINFTNLFKGIELPCVKERRINNQLDAPQRTSAFQTMPRKQFDEDDDNTRTPSGAVSFSELNKKMLIKLKSK